MSKSGGGSAKYCKEASRGKAFPKGASGVPCHSSQERGLGAFQGASKCLRSAEARPCSEGPRGRYNLTGRGRLGPAALAAGQGAGKKETLRQGS